VIDAGSGTASSGDGLRAFGTQTVTFNSGAASGATQNATLSPVNDTLLEGRRDGEPDAPEPGRLGGGGGAGE
jgi:hypothetical protein